MERERIMPRGRHPNSLANLEKNKLQKGLPTEHQRKVQSAGSKAGVEAVQELKTFQELDREKTTNAEREKILEKVKTMAEHGNLRAVELYLQYTGQKPADKVVVDMDDDEAIGKLKEAIALRRAKRV